jgi:hypothetical protein
MDDFGSSVFLARMLAGPVAALASAMVILLVLAPVVIYLVARWRGAADAHLGIKFALHYFAISAFQLALAGGALLLWTMISPGSSDAKSAPLRSAFAMLVPALIVLGLHLMLLKRTNDDQLPGVRRLFAGYNLIVTGLVGFLGLMLACQALFAKGSTHGMGQIAGAMLVVYGTAWALLGWRFGQLVLGGDGFGASAPGPLATAAPPAPAVPAPPGAPSGGLPPLGGGSYPPLNQ